ncbi:LPS-assembly protein LptD [Steroidobacter denitrificans]|uniref:LPS-assembly protein LptD n=1 Tax=Steroidobacter denitrificans TaxID=465721 RepID=UPI001AEFBC45|nr:LPS assembly protein LptD [Steroidobacter denitrificans]
MSQRPSCARTAPGRVPIVRAILAALLTLAGGIAAGDCPDRNVLHDIRLLRGQAPASTDRHTPEAGSEKEAERSVDFEADSLEATRDGEMLLKGDVVIRQGGRRLETRNAVYDSRTQSFRVDQGMEYSDPALRVSGTGARLDSQGAAIFDSAQFELRGQSARGSAARIRASTGGELQLDDVRYTTCPIGNEDWVLRAADIDIDQNAGVGVGRGVRLDFKGLPIFYTPFISFPVGDERKSGFLFPSFGTSSRNGYSLSVPWYWNIAPNYDATFTPTWYSRRGARLDSEFRFLNALGQGSLQANILPHDQRTGVQRSQLIFSDRSDFTGRLRLDINAANVSDSQWFEDFGLGPEGTSISYLDRSAKLTWMSDRWLASLYAQNFQTVDSAGIDPLDRPHTLLPQLTLHGSYPDQAFGLTLDLDMELANFRHNVAAVDSGWRIDMAPGLRMPLRGAGVYLEPAASWRYTAYRIDDVETPRDDSPYRSTPLFSLDGGLVFERLSGSRQQRLHTIEPRFMYLYVPYRNQDALPVFDTDIADLNLVQLFRTNRYVSADRLSDANQLSVGFTSRLLDAATGQQFLSATIGQAYYFSRPRVMLPGEVLDSPESSDIVAQLDLRAYQNWSINMGVQWDPGEIRAEKGDLRVQYQPARDRVANLGYRFRRNHIEQVDGSFGWPIAKDWNAYARIVYSLEDEMILDQFAGLEYRSCCWRLRFVARRYVSDRTGNRDTSILLQLELNGLSNVGVGADAFLERSIRGYSFDAEQP